MFFPPFFLPGGGNGTPKARAEVGPVVAPTLLMVTNSSSKDCGQGQFKDRMYWTMCQFLSSGQRHRHTNLTSG